MGAATWSLDERSRVVHRRMHRAHGMRRRLFTRGVSTHAVADDEERAIGITHVRVFVQRSFAADVARAEGMDLHERRLSRGLAMDWPSILIQGTLLGGLYAMFATGLSLSFGVMRLVNIAHGDLIVLAAYLALATVNATGAHPLVSLAVVVPIMALFGYLLQRGILNGVLGGDV